MSGECTHDCSSCGENCASREKPPGFIEKPHESANIKKVIAVVSGKGGVGKSMVTSLWLSPCDGGALTRLFSTPILPALQSPPLLAIHEKAGEPNRGSCRPLQRRALA